MTRESDQMTSIHEASHGRRHPDGAHGHFGRSGQAAGEEVRASPPHRDRRHGDRCRARRRDSFLASANRGVGVPTADHSYDQIENLRGAATFSAGTAGSRLPLSAFPASARDYQSAAKPEIAPTTASRLPLSAFPVSARDYQSAAKPEIAPTTASRLPQSAFPPSARDYQSASKPEIAPMTAFPLPQSAFPPSARDYQSASKPEVAPTTPVLAGGAQER